MMQIRFRNLDVITENIVEPDLQRTDTGPGPLASFDLRDVLLLFWLRFRSSSSSASYPARIVPPSAMLIGGVSEMRRDDRSRTSGTGSSRANVSVSRAESGC